jgi:uncharacterized membrane protein
MTAGTPKSETHAASPGLTWARVMLFLEVLECLMLVEVVFFDRAPGSGFGAIGLYFCAVVATVLGQVAGIVLVRRGQYRVGGLVQIVSSAIHVLKGEGLIGVIGGMRARAYARQIEGVSAASGAEARPPHEA